jgi:hypothetical protein
MNEYMTAQEAAEKWGITTRRVQVLCSEGRIPGAVKYASVWAIPREAKKPQKIPAGPKSKKKQY